MPKALEIAVNEIAKVKVEGEFVPVQFLNSFCEFGSALSIEAGAGSFSVGVLAVCHEAEREESLIIRRAGAAGGSGTHGRKGGAGGCEKAAAGRHKRE